MATMDRNERLRGMSINSRCVVSRLFTIYMCSVPTQAVIITFASSGVHELLPQNSRKSFY